MAPASGAEPADPDGACDEVAALHGGTAFAVVEGVGRVDEGGVMDATALRAYETGDVLMLRPMAEDWVRDS